jgi:predicted kinase
MNQKILILRGLPHSGKTEFANVLCSQDSNYILLSPHELRVMFRKSMTEITEIFTWNCIFDCMENALVRGYNVILDDCNLDPVIENKCKMLASELKDNKNLDINVEIKDFKIDINEALRKSFQEGGKLSSNSILEIFHKYIRNDKN